MFLNCRISCSSSDFLLFSVSRFLVGVQHVLRLTVFCFSPFFPFSSLQCSRLRVFFRAPLPTALCHVTKGRGQSVCTLQLRGGHMMQGLAGGEGEGSQEEEILKQKAEEKGKEWGRQTK